MNPAMKPTLLLGPPSRADWEAEARAWGINPADHLEKTTAELRIVVLDVARDSTARAIQNRLDA